MIPMRVRASVISGALALGAMGCAVPALGPAPSGFQHDDYVLVCEDVDEPECRRRADEAARFWPIGGSEPRTIRSITVRPEESEICASASWGLTYCYWTVTLGEL